MIELNLLIGYFKYFFSKKIIYNFFFIIVFILFFRIFLNSYINIIGGGWAYNELFINYSGGIVRRGLFGHLFLELNKINGVNPIIFFGILFSLLYSFQIYIYYKILKKFSNFKFLIIFILFSPALLLFPIYENDVYYVKDVLTNISILLHCYFIISRKEEFNYEKYNKFIIFFLIPLLSINLFNHENQFFFIPVHILFSLYIYELNNVKNVNRKYIYYLITVIPVFFLLLNSGSWEKVYAINNSISEFNVKINDQLAGNINLAIGGFIKWHFFFQNIDKFLKFFISLILTFFVFYAIFGYILNKKIFKIDRNIKNIYLLFFTPSLALFILALDYGRNINLILTHLISFYLILQLDNSKFIKLYNNLSKNFLFRNFLILFLIFNSFMWFLPQGGGYSGIATFTDNSTILKNTLLGEFREIFMIIYNFIDTNLFDLPRVIV